MMKEAPIDKASKKSSKGVGIGNNNTINMPIIEQAKTISPYLEKLLKILLNIYGSFEII